ncbi:biotin synthase auxiliary protein BsaP [Saccharomonospora cyanea]|uniref:Biotin synthase auxiliary protein n=1 Tax=Saccharomonospora cyanea NA-134 TaxID=882082 RepID=H5XCF3_9PSEU|nr:hypothetical protein [Saccharomonospora cyanea]EHR60168.1 hypothetical protein SaccyDRAFT_1259 [Saccharomonospora cyanea NA-134]
MNTTYCVHCGGLLSAPGHEACRTPRTALEPPRYCSECGRRMVVQVTPSGWSARCSRHGETSSMSSATTG